MRVSDLISALQLQDPVATVVLRDPRLQGGIAALGVGEVQPVRLQAKQEFGVVWLQLAEPGEVLAWPGVALGSERAVPNLELGPERTPLRPLTPELAAAYKRLRMSEAKPGEGEAP